MKVWCQAVYGCGGKLHEIRNRITLALGMCKLFQSLSLILNSSFPMEKIAQSFWVHRFDKVVQAQSQAL